jgi:TolB-like protein
MVSAKKAFICFLLSASVMSVHAQEPAATIDPAIVALAGSLAERLPAGTIVAMLNFSAPETRASEYIIEEFNTVLANLGRLRVVDRRNLELLQQELNFQMSGDVSDESAQAIGRMLGAQAIISGSLSPMGDGYRMRIQAISVETAQIQSADTADIVLDRRLANLLGIRLAEEIPPWANKWLYFGIRGGGSLRLYSLSDDIEGDLGATPLSLEAGAQLSLQIVRFLAIQIEALYTRDSLEYTGDTSQGNTYQSSFASSSLLPGALVKATWRTRRFLFAAFGGAYMTIPLGQIDYKSDIDEDGSYDFSVPVGVTGGVNFGIKMGPGALFLDARYSKDLGNTSISDSGGTMAVYSRDAVSLSLGYEFGIFGKN